MFLSSLRSLWNRIRLLAWTSYAPLSTFDLGADPHPHCSLVLSWRCFWYKQNRSLLSDTDHKKFILLLEQEDLNEALSSEQKKNYFKPSAIFRKAKLDSVSKSPQFMVTRAAFTWEDGGGRHATCMHSKLKQKVSDNGQLAQAKKGLGTSRSSDRKGKDIMKFCSEAGRKQFIIVVPEKIPSLCSCWECPLKT